MSRTTRTIGMLILIAIMGASLWFAAANAHLSGKSQAAGAVPQTKGDSAAPEAETWNTLHGVVVGQTGNRLTIRTDDGEEMEMGLGPWGYWLGHGIALSPNDKVEIRGFVSNGEFEPAEIHNLTTGESITLRDADGAPLWRGAEH
jgi:uncharacterized protein YdeI (BOF family)